MQIGVNGERVSQALSSICEKYYQLRLVCLYVRIEQQLGSQFTDFHEICYLMLFRKSVENVKLPLKSGKNMGRKYFYDNVSLNSFQNE